MNPLSIALLALAMSADAFAAAIAKGAALARPSWREALRTGLIFGSIEAITPLVGWALGSAAAPYVAAWDHWIAFAVLGLLGALAGQFAEIVGGLLLIGIGSAILVRHLSAAGG